MKSHNDNNPAYAVKHGLSKQQRKAHAQARRERKQARGKVWVC